MPPKHLPRKLLIASIGVATINYVATACGGSTTTDSSFKDGGSDRVEPPTSGNLPSPPPTSANLPAPPPPIDAGDAGDAGDASDDADADGG